MKNVHEIMKPVNKCHEVVFSYGVYAGGMEWQFHFMHRVATRSTEGSEVV